jgi:F0F1-type ATP synthase assembly protein I
MRKPIALLIGLLIGINAAMFLVTASTAAAKQSSDPWRDGQPPMPRRGEHV